MQTPNANSGADLKRERKLARRAERRVSNGQTEEAQGNVGSYNSSYEAKHEVHSDLKRERKLARRAERRAQAEA